jgi:hypothetical protein
VGFTSDKNVEQNYKNENWEKWNTRHSMFYIGNPWGLSQLQQEANNSIKSTAMKQNGAHLNLHKY